MAVLVVVVLELDELDEDEVVELLELVEIRLVAACNADDMLLEVLLDAEELVLAFDDDAFEVMVGDGLSELVVLLRSRPNPDRLPRMDGVRMVEKFSAPVTPVSRMMLSRPPFVTTAVRTATVPAAAASSDAARFASNQ